MTIERESGKGLKFVTVKDVDKKHVQTQEEEERERERDLLGNNVHDEASQRVPGLALYSSLRY